MYFSYSRQIVEKMPDYKLQFLPQYFEPSSLDVEQSGINGGSASASKSHKQRVEQRFLWNVGVILDQVKVNMQKLRVSKHYQCLMSKLWNMD